MPELQHHFRLGKMNKDLDERLVPNGEYRDAQNIEIVTSEGSDVGSVQNVVGNQLKDGKTYNVSTEALTLWGTGNSSEAKAIKELTNPECVGSVVDTQNDKIYWFIATSDQSVSAIAEFNYATNEIKPVLVDKDGKTVKGEGKGRLCMAASWPGQMRTVYGDHQRFIDTYFSQFDGKYFTGDGCRRDKDGYYWITGRVDDVIIVSGHNLGTAEIESAFVEHELVSEAAVVGYPHDIKGQGIYAYVTTNTGVEVSEDLKKELVQWIRTKIGPIATPDKLQFSPGLPKTRSGKIMRRILRKIASKEEEQLGDTSTLADPNVVQSLIDGSKNI